MKLIAWIAALALTGALAVAGCGGGSSTTSTSPSAAPPQTSAGGGGSGGGAAPSGNTITVDMKDIQFSPKTVKAKVGQTIKWVNQDTVDHNVTGTNDKKIASDNFGEGGTYSFKVTKPGKIDYTCTLHPGMDGEIVVSK